MDTKEGTYTFTDYKDEKYIVPIEWVFSLSQLHKGDHIAIKRPEGYWHHAIVEDVLTARGVFNVIEYSSRVGEYFQDISDLRSPGWAKVMRGNYRLEDGLYLIKYHIYLSAEDVVVRARSRLGENEYTIFGNNCEHFSLWCKTGISMSQQVKNIGDAAKKAAIEDGPALLLALMHPFYLIFIFYFYFSIFYKLKQLLTNLHLQLLTYNNSKISYFALK